MFTDILAQLNWVDILAGCIIAWSVYSGIKNGVVSELINLLGLFVTIYITLHYYSRFAVFLNKTVFIPKIIVEFLSVFLIAGSLFLILKLAICGFLLLFKTEAHPTFTRWGGVLIGLVRGFYMVSLLFLILYVMPIRYTAKSFKKSYSGIYLINLSVSFYQLTFDGLVKKLFDDEVFNQNAVNITKPKESKK